MTPQEFKEKLDNGNLTLVDDKTQSIQENGDEDVAYTIEPTTYTNKKGKTTPMHLVKFGKELSKEEIRAGKELAKESRGWWDSKKGGFMMRSEESAKELAETLAKGDEEIIADAQPISMNEIQELNNGDLSFTEPKEDKKSQADGEYRPIWQYSIHIDEDGYTTITRDDVSSGYPIGDARFRYSTDSPEEMLEVLSNPLNGMEDVLDAVGVTLKNKIKMRELQKKEKEERKRKYELLRANGYNGYKIGDDVIYKGKKAKIHDLEEFGEHRPVLDTGMAPVVYVVADWNEIENPQQNQPASSDKGQQDNEEKKAKSKWVNDEDAERFEELRKKLRNKIRGQVNMGIDPEVFTIGVEISYLMLKKGARKFGDFAKSLIDAIGDEVRPYIKAFYNGVRDMPEMSEYKKDMTPYEDVINFDVMNFDNEGARDILGTAEHVIRENSAEHEAKVATDRIKQKRNEKRKESEKGQRQAKSGKKEKKSVTSQREQSLFGNLFDEQEQQKDKNDNEKSDVRTRTAEGRRERHNKEQNGTLGESAEYETSRPDGGRVGGRDSAHTGTDTKRGSGVSRVSESKQRLEQQQREKRNQNNNRAERGKDYAPKSVDARIEANIAAIELMQKLIDSGRRATAKEMAILRKFSGWGGLGKAFNERAYGYDAESPANRLRKLLGEEGYEQANMSRNSAYFTPANVIDALWDIARSLGFKGGKVLEGSAGIGNILGLMPQDMSERSDIHAIEIDGTTGGILSLLYPDAKVEIQGFEATRIPNGSVD
ncbi:MAG: hypothetical protein ACI4TK_08230, partial [Agathobacter sp.]